MNAKHRGRAFPVGLSSMTGRRSIFFDGDKPPAPVALVDLPEPDLTTAEGLKKAVRDYQVRINELSKRPSVSQDEWKNVLDSMQAFGTQLGNVESIAKAAGRGAALDTDSAIRKNRLSLELPDDVKVGSRTYFNLMALQPEELVGATLQGRQVYPGLNQTVERWGRDGGLARDIAKLREFQMLNDSLLLTHSIMWGNGGTAWARQFQGPWEAMRSLKQWRDFERIGLELQKGLEETNATSGLNWVPTILSAQLVDLVQAQLRVAALFPQITMTSKTLDNPVLGGDATAYLTLETTGDGVDTPTGALIAASKPTLNKMTFTAQKLAMRVFASSEIIEDSIVAMVPFITGNIAKVIARGIEDAIINGDKASTFMDGTTYNPAAGPKRAWNGLRQIAVETASYPAFLSASNAALSNTHALSVLAAQKAYGAVVSEGVWIVGFKGWANLLNNAAMVTLEKYGAGATILTGEVGRFFGRPVILSEFVTDNYNASGVYDGTTTDRGVVIHAYRSAFALAQRRALSIAASSERHIEFDQTVFVGTWRGDFEGFYVPSATLAPVGVIYNVGGP